MIGEIKRSNQLIEKGRSWRTLSNATADDGVQSDDR
jgi:hypothetical protein